MAETERIVETEVDENAWRQHITRYEFAKDFVADKAVLDVACGTGYGTYFLSGYTQKPIIGVDVSSDAVMYAKTHYLRSHLEYHVGDALNLGPYGGVDVVVSLETIEHLQDPDNFLGQVVHVLPPEGTFIVSTPNRKNGRLSDKPRNPFHVREWNVTEFTDLLSRYFGQVNIYHQFVCVGKRAYPGSRMLANVILKLFHAEVLPNLHRWEVSTPLDVGIPLVHLIPRYVVALCRGPKK